MYLALIGAIHSGISSICSGDRFACMASVLAAAHGPGNMHQRGPVISNDEAQQVVNHPTMTSASDSKLQWAGVKQWIAEVSRNRSDDRCLPVPPEHLARHNTTSAINGFGHEGGLRDVRPGALVPAGPACGPGLRCRSLSGCGPRRVPGAGNGR